MKKIAVVGYKGKMGSPIFLALKEKYKVFGVGRGDRLDDLPKLDLVVDVASHESSVISAEYCLRNKIPIVIGSTGQTQIENDRLAEIADSVTMIRKANFSQAVETTKHLIDEVLKLKPTRILIKEKHHAHKKDSPSGTALMIKEHIEALFDGPVEIQSIREGEEMGEHLIKFCFSTEELEIKHNVLSRMAFVNGLLKDVDNLFEKIDKFSKNL